MAIDAIRCYLESAVQLGEDIPEDVTIDRQPLKEHLAVSLAA